MSKKALKNQLATLFECLPKDLDGENIVDMLREAEEYSNITVFWGCIRFNEKDVF